MSRTEICISAGWSGSQYQVDSSMHPPNAQAVLLIFRCRPHSSFVIQLDKVVCLGPRRAPNKRRCHLPLLQARFVLLGVPGGTHSVTRLVTCLSLTSWLQRLIFDSISALPIHPQPSLKPRRFGKKRQYVEGR